jgi:ABC-type bacteriocin/lantibiotic exporter with double-glycine peptidase domain
VIALPDLRQSAEHDCGHTAVLVVLRRLRRRVSPGDLSPLGVNMIDGTDPRAIESTLRGLGLRVISGEMDMSDLWHHTESSRPVICLIRRDGVGHYVVVSGIHEGAVRFQDPADGPSSMRTETWKKAWTEIDRLGAVYRGWGIAVHR